MTLSLLILRWANARGRERADGLALAQASDLRTIFRGETIVVLASADIPIAFGENGLMLFGSMHGDLPRPTGHRPVEVLQQLSRSVWGSYLALIASPDGCFAMVDPSGAGRAHLVRDDDLVMVTDRLTPALMDLAGYTISVDLAAVAGCLVDPGTIVPAPLIDGVLPMTPGVMYDLAGKDTPHTIWSPRQIAAGEGDGSMLRQTVDDAVGAMVNGQTPLLELSGGLDSSILAGIMSALEIEARAVTVELIGGDVDELRYARATAERCGIPLHVGRVADYPPYASFMETEQAAHPYTYGVDDAFAGVVRDGEAAGTDCVITGQGGDAVFYQPATPYTTIDRFRALGLTSGWGALLDDARRTRSSIWRHLREVARDRLHPQSLPEDELAGNLLTRAALDGRRRFQHPWRFEAKDEPPGRQLHILMLANSLSFHSARAVDLGRPLIHPLLSQPVIEAALAIPTWQLAIGPLDRGLARQLFADRLHPSIAGRRSKGEAGAFYSRAAVANLPYLRERLLDGALAKAGIIDRQAMGRTLTADHLFYSLDYRALILHAAVEAWLSAWTA